MQRFVVHLFISVAVCGFVVGAWALTSGSFAELSDIAGNPTLARELGFWPIWVILAAAAVLVVDLGFVVAGVSDPQIPHSDAALTARKIGAPAPVYVPGRHLTMISSPRQVAAAIDSLRPEPPG